MYFNLLCVYVKYRNKLSGQRADDGIKDPARKRGKNQTGANKLCARGYFRDARTRGYVGSRSQTIPRTSDERPRPNAPRVCTERGLTLNTHAGPEGIGAARTYARSSVSTRARSVGRIRTDLYIIIIVISAVNVPKRTCLFLIL